MIKDTRSSRQESVSLLPTWLLDDLVDRNFPLTVAVLDQPGDALLDTEGRKAGTSQEWSLLVPEVGIAGVATTRAEAEESLLKALVDYASDFFSDPGFYLNKNSGRRHHWGYVRRVLRCEGNMERLRALLGL